MRYLTEPFAVGALHRGRSIEQFLGPTGDPSVPAIRWVEIVPIPSGYKVVLHTSQDVGGEHFCDLVEFPPLDPDEDLGQEIASTPGAHDALAEAHNHAEAARDRWVNQSMAGDEYLDYVRAGRPNSALNNQN